MPSLKDQILESVLTHDWVSFAELSRIPGFVDLENGWAKLHPEFENMILWSGISDEGCAALDELREEGKIHWEVGNPFSYMIDGARMPMPLAKSARNYKTPHWLPVFYRPGPMPEDLLKAYERREAKRRADAIEALM
ncbi:hypothetical protein ACVIGB_006603 [Bradyrhizobium sp. USDA 4341]